LDIIHFDTKIALENPASALVWVQASILATIRFQRRSWSKIMEGINLKVISEMTLVIV
jgi:hypothetical protein